MELSVYKIDGTVAKTVTLPEEIFGITQCDLSSGIFSFDIIYTQFHITSR